MAIIDIIERIPSIREVTSRLQRLAMLDAIHSMSDPMYSYQIEWRYGVDLGQMDNGAGDRLTVISTPDGIMMFGFDHESSMSPWVNQDHKYWPGITDGLPSFFRVFLTDPELTTEVRADATFITWQTSNDEHWHCGSMTMPPDDTDADGANWILECIVDYGTDFVFDHLHNYWGNFTAHDAAVRSLVNGELLTPEIIKGIKGTAEVNPLMDKSDMIGYASMKPLSGWDS